MTAQASIAHRIRAVVTDIGYAETPIDRFALANRLVVLAHEVDGLPVRDEMMPYDCAPERAQHYLRSAIIECQRAGVDPVEVWEAIAPVVTLPERPCLHDCRTCETMLEHRRQWPTEQDLYDAPRGQR